MRAIASLLVLFFALVALVACAPQPASLASRSQPDPTPEPARPRFYEFYSPL